VLEETESGNVLERKVGPITLEDIVAAAERTRSGSRRIFGRLGTMEARIATTSSDLSIAPGNVPRRSSSPLTNLFPEVPFELLESVKVGLVVKRAVISLKKRSYKGVISQSMYLI
jgi:hypothetical protein